MHGLIYQYNDFTIVIFETVVYPTEEISDCFVFVFRVTYNCDFRYGLI